MPSVGHYPRHSRQGIIVATESTSLFLAEGEQSFQQDINVCFCERFKPRSFF